MEVSRALFLQPFRLRPLDRENEGGVRPSVRPSDSDRPDSLEAPINFFSRSCRMIVGENFKFRPGVIARARRGGRPKFPRPSFFHVLLRKKQRLLRRKDVGILFAGLEL